MTTTPEPTPGETLPAEIVSAILRDPTSPYYPAQIGVFCDDCGTTVEADYMVSDDMDQAARFEVARVHLRTLGWQCDDDADLCPNCAAGEVR